MAREDRGEFRGLYTALFDGPDYQQLGPAARLVLLTLRLTTGPCAIAVIPALSAVLSVRTGLSLAPDLLKQDPELAVPTALEELRQRGWIETEGSVVWVIRGLEFEPQFTPSNANHRKHVQMVYASLPRLAIRERFRQRYAEWFDAAPEAPPIPSAGDMKAPRSREEEEEGKSRAPDMLLAAAREDFARQCVGVVNRALDSRLAGAYKPLVATVEQEVTDAWVNAGVTLPLALQVLAGAIARYRSTPRSRQPNSLRYFTPVVLESVERTRVARAGGLTGNLTDDLAQYAEKLRREETPAA